MNHQKDSTTAGLLPRDSLDELLVALDTWGRVLVPTQAQGGATEFAPRGTGAMDLSRVNTRVSAKNLVFPQCEPLFRWTRPPTADVACEPCDEPARAVLFGIRPCDARALKILDLLFIDDTDFDSVNKDALYARRREALTLVGLGCVTCEPTCFCTAFGFSPLEQRDCDLFLVPLETDYLVEAVSQRGRDIAAALGDLLHEPGPDVSARRSEVHEAVCARQEKVPSPTASEKGLDTDGAFSSPYWERLTETCLGCMACTYLCPTCHCYELRDEGPRGEGCRYRLHDGCMSAEFTLHASGHNPRAQHFKRWRQRAFHKFSWFPKNLGTPLCVGCGRCTLYCPVGVDLVEILDATARLSNEEV